MHTQVWGKSAHGDMTLAGIWELPCHSKSNQDHIVILIILAAVAERVASASIMSSTLEDALRSEFIF